jgi:hypothetical protein
MNQQKQLKRKNYRPGGGPYLNASELAAALGESERTILSWRHNGVIPFVDLGFRTKRITSTPFSAL